MKAAIFYLTAFTFLNFCSCRPEHESPNIIWIMMEDWGYELP